MTTDLFLAQDGLSEGHAIVIDMEGATLSHLARVNIIALKKFMFYIQVTTVHAAFVTKNNYNFWSKSTNRLTGSVASSLERFTFYQHCFIHGQGFGFAASIHEEGIDGCDVFAHNGRHIYR